MRSIYAPCLQLRNANCRKCCCHRYRIRCALVYRVLDRVVCAISVQPWRDDEACSVRKGRERGLLTSRDAGRPAQGSLAEFSRAQGTL